MDLVYLNENEAELCMPEFKEHMNDAIQCFIEDYANFYGFDDLDELEGFKEALLKNYMETTLKELGVI